MEQYLSIKICKGATLPHPITGILLKEGDTAKVPNTSFWRRRIKEGSAKIVAGKKPVVNSTTNNSSKNSNSKEK